MWHFFVCVQKCAKFSPPPPQALFSFSILQKVYMSGYRSILAGRPVSCKPLDSFFDTF